MKQLMDYVNYKMITYDVLSHYFMQKRGLWQNYTNLNNLEVLITFANKSPIKIIILYNFNLSPYVAKND